MEEEVLQKYQEAGTILTEALEYGREMIEPGASVLEICDEVEAMIRDNGGEIAFPAQISRNEVAAHACPAPNSEEVCEEGDLVKLDCGVHIDGYIADSAVTVNLGVYDDLVKAAREALDAALDTIGIGVTVSEVGQAIQEVIESYDYSPVRNLSGHGLARYDLHNEPSIPNYNSGSDFKFKEDMVVAVEPFASTGAGIIYESNNPTVFMMLKSKPVRNRTARELLKEIKGFKGLPFTTRWLTRNRSEGKVRLGMRELVKKDIVKEYPPLVDKQDGMISQAEHTVIIKDKPIITTKP